MLSHPQSAVIMPDARSNFTADEQPSFDKVERLIEQACDDFIEAHWALGETLLEEERDWTKNGRDINSDVLYRMEKALGCQNDSVLHTARRFVEAYGSRENLNRYTRLRGPDNRRLSYAHLIHLAAIQDTSIRLLLARTCVNEGWDASELLHLVVAYRNYSPHCHGTGPARRSGSRAWRTSARCGNT